MMATGDILTILYQDVCASLLGQQIPLIYRKEHDPVEEHQVPERIVIVVNATNNEDWQQAYGHVCVYVPKIYSVRTKAYYPNEERLLKLERICNELYTQRRFGEFEGRTIYYQAETIRQEDDKATWSDFINVRLKITNSNFKL